MYTKEKFNEILEKIASAIDISEALFDKAEIEYTALGKWIDEATQSYAINIYPQGSFALGTVIKPLTDNDEYDLDLVCELEKSYGLSAKQLKVNIIKPLLISYKKTTTDIVEKRRCWCVEYDHFKGFHMDVIPAIHGEYHIKITEKDEEKNTYEYIGSNPKGYIDWFNGRKRIRYAKILEAVQHSKIVKCEADIAPIKEYQLKTPLQKAIQILKRHRDKMFENDKNNIAPISIIITTLVAHLYNNEETIYDVLASFVNGARSYIDKNKKNGNYYIENPSFTGENFSDKWIEHPERAEAFFEWLDKVRLDFVDQSLLQFNRVKLAERLNESVGEVTVNRIFSEMAETEKQNIQNQTAKVIAVSGAIDTKGTVAIPTNHHHGK